MQTRSWPALGLIVLLHLLLLAWVLFAYREPTDRRQAQPALAMSRIVLSLLADKPPAPLRAQDLAPARRATSSAQRSEQSPAPPPAPQLQSHKSSLHLLRQRTSKRPTIQPGRASICSCR